MVTQKRHRDRIWARVAPLALLGLFVLGACDDEGGSGGEVATGATLRGTVTVFETATPAPADGVLPTAQVPDVRVAVGARATQTDASGDFILHDIPLGDQTVSFSKDATVGNYVLSGVAEGATFVLDGVQYSGGAVSTAHTGTWVGTGGSDDPGGFGQVALTMILEANGNTLTGTASVGSPDNTTWSISGYEDGTAVNGAMSVVSTDSPCASGGTFVGAFDADTLRGDFVEVNPPAGCGPPESGTFRVVKQ